MSMRKGSVILIVLSLLLLVLLCVSCAGPASTPGKSPATTAVPTPESVKTKVLRFSAPLPANDPMVISEAQATEEFNAVAGGKYKIEMYPGGVLGSMSETLELTMSGAIDICDTGGFSSISGKDARFSAQSLPFQLKDYNASQKFYDLIRQKIWQNALRENFHVELLSLTSGNAYQYLGTSPIHTMADWKGKVLWVANATEAEVVTALHGSGTVLDWADGPSAMEKGVVDGCLRPGSAAVLSKWEMLKYATRCNFNFAGMAIVMNVNAFNSMPSDLQAALMKAFKAHQDRQVAFWGNKEIEPYEQLKAKGWEIYALPADERAKWVDTVKPIIDKYYSKLNPSDAEIVKGIFIEANK
jgi:TRAP-type C4-dicarboxylate transport system substrate-binding protein